MTHQRRTFSRRAPEILWTSIAFFCFCLPAFSDWLNRG